MNPIPFILFIACIAKAPTESDWQDTGVSEPGIDTGEEAGDDEPEPIEEMDPSSLLAGSEPCRDPVLGRVQEITDGDTFKVETGRGVERVRMIGIDTPEVDHSGPDDECFGEEASLFLEEQINGELVWLTFDAECDDQYDRTLAYVHTHSAFVQRSLLQAGMASSYRVSPNTSFSSMFESDESAARASGVGMWGECS